jgi:perosamine synthetase
MIPLFKVHMPKAVDEPLLEVLHSGYITQGPVVDLFEKDFAKVIDNPYTLAVNSGTSALTLALRLAGVGPGDEVITTPMTCAATNLPILSLFAKPVFADVDPLTGLIDPLSVAKLINERTKAIMCVGWGGLPPEHAALRQIADYYGIKIIEDAAHSLGAWDDGTRIGSLADFTCFSLQAIKHITTVDGGMLACRDKADYLRGKKLRWFGIDRETPSADSRIDQDIEEWGYKFHMNDVAATIGAIQLTYLDEIISAHRKNAAAYDRYLDDRYFTITNRAEAMSSYWLYTILLPNAEARDDFKTYMTKKKIQVNQVHRRNDEYSVFAKYRQPKTPGLDNFASRMICIPVHWHLSKEDIFYIIASCNEFARGHA